MADRKITLAEIIQLVGGELVGLSDVVISRLMDLDSAVDGDISFVTSSKRLPEIATTRASAVIVPRFVEGSEKPQVRVADPYLAVAILQNYFYKESFVAIGVSPGAYVGKGCSFPERVSIYPMAVLGNNVSLGQRVTLHPGVVIGDDVAIGDDSVLYPNVFVGTGCKIGARVIIHAGAVVGSDGFGYARDEERSIKIPQVGIVQIDDDVEIGANVTIDRATFGKTWIKRGVKIDNLVQVAHNVIVGEDSVLVAQVGIAGSTILGKGVILAGQVGVGGHVSLGDGVMVGAKSGVHSDLPPGARVSGIPAVAHTEWLRAVSVLPKLAELVKEVRGLRKRVSALELLLEKSDRS